MCEGERGACVFVGGVVAGGDGEIRIASSTEYVVGPYFSRFGLGIK
jgi:hypothetical protein